MKWHFVDTKRGYELVKGQIDLEWSRLTMLTCQLSDDCKHEELTKTSWVSFSYTRVCVFLRKRKKERSMSVSRCPQSGQCHRISLNCDVFTG